MRRRLWWIASGALVGLSAAATVWASKVQVWEVAGAKAMLEGKFEHALVTSQGRLRLSLDVRPLTKLEAAFVWALAADADGHLLAATGNEGRIFKIVDGKPSVFVETQELEVTCLAVPADPKDKAVYAGTAPNGKILKIAPSGKSEVVYDSPETYVWSLAVAADGTLFAGTGPNGRLYQITPDRKASVLFDCDQSHILSVALGPKGVVYAGTDREGLVYAIGPDKKASVVYDAPESEIRVLLIDPDGTLYAGTADPRQPATSVPAPGRTAPSSVSGKSGGSGGPAEEMRDMAAPTATRSAVFRPSGEPARGASRPGGPPAPAGRANSVYRLSPDGLVRRIFTESDAMVLALARDGERLLVGTGPEGELYEIGPREETSLLARVDQPEVMAMARVKGTVVFGTGSGAHLYAVSDTYAPKGTFLSEVKDTEQISRWGRLSWTGTFPPGTQVTLATRTGNVKKPDDTWSAWSPEMTRPEGEMPPSPAGRFIQFRVTLTATAPKTTPVVETVRLYYAQDNLAPEIKELTVEPPRARGRGSDGGPRPAGGAGGPFPGTTVKWKAEDPNKDDLAYTLYFRKVGWETWIDLEIEPDKTQFQWDTRSLPTGLYQVRLVASDKPDNAPDQALEAVEVSSPFPIDHQPPEIVLKVEKVAEGKATILATVTDQLTVVEKAQYCVDGKEWKDLFPIDRLFDSRQEQFRFTTDALAPGPHIVIVRAADSHDNVATGDVTVTVGK